MSRTILTAEGLRELVNYDPQTGLFTWRVKRKGCRVGDVIGTPKEGYISIGIDYHRYYAHRLAWLYMTGEWPTSQIDHRNLNRADTRWDNLRQATNQQNQANQFAQSNNKLGVKGVSKLGKKYRAVLHCQGKPKYLGLFDTTQEASDAYIAAARHLFGEFARAA